MSLTLESLAQRVAELEREVADLRAKVSPLPGNGLSSDEALDQAKRSAANRIDPMGMFAHLGPSISKEEIDEANEAWANFPRDFPERPPNE
jgi:cell division protein FtsB